MATIDGASPGLARRAAPVLVGVAAIAVAVALWQGAAEWGFISTFTAPAPSDIARSFPALFTEEGLVRRFFQTFAETFLAAGFAVAIGIPLGWWLHRQPLAGLAYENWIGGFAGAPLVVAYPLFLVLFGRNTGTIVVMSCLSGLPAMVLKTKEGLDGTRRVLINVGRSFGLRPSAMFWKIMLPAAIPTIANGVRLALIFALINVVGVEFLINFGGLGELIDDLAQRWELPAMFGAILFVILTSVAFFWATGKAEKWFRPHG
jgi:ABC-type nitrate/sulfonate/bicarbonate transport system permease component